MFKFFISSTFSDMHTERVIIFSKIIPILNMFGYQHSQGISATDLRWGIDTLNLTTGTEMNKIFSVCMAEIDKCRPYMIIMLGDRANLHTDKAENLFTCILCLKKRRFIMLISTHCLLRLKRSFGMGMTIIWSLRHCI